MDSDLSSLSSPSTMEAHSPQEVLPPREAMTAAAAEAAAAAAAVAGEEPAAPPVDPAVENQRWLNKDIRPLRDNEWNAVLALKQRQLCGGNHHWNNRVGVNQGSLCVTKF